MMFNRRRSLDDDGQTNTFGRRNVLRAMGVAGAAGVLGAGRVAAHGGAVAGTGDVLDIGAGSVWTYTERTRGRLSTVGVRFDAAALTGLPSTIVASNLSLPNGDTGRFEYVGVDWNPAGHEPAGLYTYPHFDFHFYMLDEETIAAIPGGPVSYEIPEALMPADTVTTADLPPGQASPRFAVPGMGEHLVSLPASLPQQPGADGWSVYIWGADDPDGDGTGQLTFMEPMITVAYLAALRGDGSADAEATTPIPMPERFLKAGWYPTELVVRYHSHDDSFTVSLESFEQFAGYGRR